MDFLAYIQEILQSDVPAAFKRFGRLLDARWVESALEETGTASVRRRKLPAELVVWLVIGMGLFRDRAIQEVVSHLGLVLPSQKEKGGNGKNTLVPSAIPQARYRVGAEPLERIFSQTAEKWVGGGQRGSSTSRSQVELDELDEEDGLVGQVDGRQERYRPRAWAKRWPILGPCSGYR